VHSSRSEAQHLDFFRDVDKGLDAVHVQDPLPLVVAGTERDLAYFDHVTRHRAWVVGRLTGNHEDTNPDELARLAVPLLDNATASRRAEVIDELVEAIGPGRGMVGIKPVWDATLGGRARVLLVEEDFVYPARVVDGRLEPAGDPDSSGVIDDAVDELIELVLDRGGDVAIVEPGALGPHGPVAALLRY
jgi:peptide subunit release factor 1 (eRF1)